MKLKKFALAAAMAGVIGASSSTGFAAANPFEDVPADHWAYDAVAQLAADGVVEGYGDGTYRGDQEITRYEMAQMVARAMAKGGTGADKALIDKLAAEFADELNSLGVRVSNLEKKVDNVKWKGWVGYETYDTRTEAKKQGSHVRDQYVQLQLNPVFTINKNWTARARLKYYADMNTASNSTGRNPMVGWNDTDDSGFFMDRVWAQGNYDNFTIQLGKIYHDSPFDITEGGNGGMVLSHRVVGGIVTFGNKLKTTLGAGRFSRDANAGRANRTDSVQFIEMMYNFSDKLKGGAGYYHMRNTEAYKNGNGGFAPSYDSSKAFGDKNRNIWGLGLTYKFTPKFMTNLAYARSNGDWETKYKQAYSAEFGYNGGRYPDMSKGGNLGAFVAYRHIGKGAVISPVYDGMNWTSASYKGVELGLAYTFAKNILGTILYFKGKDIGDSDRDAQQYYGSLQFYF